MFTNGAQAWVVQLPFSLQIVSGAYAAAIAKSHGIDMTKVPQLSEYDWNAINDTFNEDQQALVAALKAN